MAYITSEQVAEKRAEIKKAFPGWKFSITREDYSCIIVKILSAPLDFPLVNDGKAYQQLHGHTFENYFTTTEHPTLAEQCREAVQKISRILQKGNHDNSDSQTDYFDVGWYIHLQIGAWDRPFVKK